MSRKEDHTLVDTGFGMVAPSNPDIRIGTRLDYQNEEQVNPVEKKASPVHTIRMMLEILHVDLRSLPERWKVVTLVTGLHG